ncbi:MAG: hypothetical protein AB7L09_04975 [Nitrospira sp.]
MATLTISLSDEELQRLEALGKRESLAFEQLVRLGVNTSYFRGSALVSCMTENHA